MNVLGAKNKLIGFALISLTAYFFLGYFVSRESFVFLVSLYMVAFIGFYFLYNSNDIKENDLFKIGVLFRIILLFCLPFWSQDFYRFIWDGRLIVSGISPYSYLPNDIIATTGINQSVELYNGMGSLSAQHYSNYPPVNQLFFAISAVFASKSIVASVFLLKLIVLFADIGIYHFGKKILCYLNLDAKNIFLYFLNPLVIIELTGNLHFEGVMLFFFVCGLYFFFKEKWIFSAILIGLSISTKLLPLLLLPFFYQILGFRKSVLFYTIIISLNVLLFLPFVSNTLINNYSETIALWFVNFEFNASFYYLFRALGYLLKGYNTIAVIGKIIPIITVLVILIFSLLRKNQKPIQLLTNSLFALTIYFLISTTVHPWYIINIVLIAVFTRYKFAVVWSLLVVLSYFTYSQIDFKENYYLLAIEYLFLLSYLIFEVSKRGKITTKIA